jgi:hypothetical protein
MAIGRNAFLNAEICCEVGLPESSGHLKAERFSHKHDGWVEFARDPQYGDGPKHISHY